MHVFCHFERILGAGANRGCWATTDDAIGKSDQRGSAGLIVIAARLMDDGPMLDAASAAELVGHIWGTSQMFTM